MNADIAREMQTLVNAHAELEARQAVTNASDKPYFEPTNDHPLMTFAVDARTGIFEYPKAVYLGEAIARDGRQMGIKLQISVDYPPQCFRDLGNSGSLRTLAEIVQGRDGESFLASA